MTELERFTLKERGRVAYEHFHRYLLCRDYAAGKKVLDLASGEGFGSYVLSGVAEEVCGVEIDEEAVDRCNKAFVDVRNLSFRAGDVRSLPFEDASFDVVIGLEIIEHIAEQAQMVQEAKRVLRDGGLAIWSTPNVEIYNRYKAPNRFHVHELSGEELRGLLGSSFSNIEILGQRLAIFSTLTPTSAERGGSNDPSYRAFTAEFPVGLAPRLDAKVTSLPEPEYFLAITSDAEIVHPFNLHSAFLSADDDMWAEHEKILAWAAGLHNEDEALRKRLENVSQELSTAREDSARALADKLELEKRIEGLDREVSLAYQAPKALEQNVSQLASIAEKLNTEASDVALGNIASVIAGLFGVEVQPNIASILGAISRSRFDLDAAERRCAALERDLAMSEDIRSSISAASNGRLDGAQAELEPVAAIIGTLVEATVESSFPAIANALSKAIYSQARISTELDAERRVIATLQTEAETLRGALAEANARAAAGSSVANLEREIAASKIETENLRSALAADRELLTEQRIALARSEAVIENFQQLADMRREQADTRLADLQNSLDVAVKRSNRLEAALEDQNKELSEQHHVMERLREMNSATESLRSENRSLKSANEQISNMVASLSDNLSSIRGDLERRSQEHTGSAELRDLIPRFEAERESLIDELASARARAGDADALAAKAGMLEEAIASEKRSSSAVLLQNSLLSVEAEKERARRALRKRREKVFRELRDAERQTVALGLNAPTTIVWRADEVSKKDKRAIASMNLFDKEWYAERVAGLRRRDALDHFLDVGLRTGLNPNPLFDVSWIASEHQVTPHDLPPVLAYIRDKRLHSLSTHPLFDPAYYSARYRIGQSDGHSLADHYRARGAAEELSTHRLISLDWIEATWPKHLRPFELTRYLSDEAYFGLSTHPLFDCAYYRARYLADEPEPVHPLYHYLMKGWKVGNNPHPKFTNDWYLQQVPQLRERPGNPLAHYLQAGMRDNLWPNPIFDPSYYLDRHVDVKEARMPPLIHFVAFGEQEKREFSRVFAGSVLDAVSIDPNSSALDLLLDTHIADVTDRGGIASISAQEWPPAPINDYWLPQALRDYVIEEYGEETIHLISYLFSVVDAYSTAPESFEESEEYEKLVARAKFLSNRVLLNQGAPLVSVIIPVYNHVLDTLVSIVSLLEHCGEESLEIIVADDGSSDATGAAIFAINGVVRIVRQPENLGFLRNCNAAAETAAGDVIVFLNNDTVILPSWLSNLVEPLRSNSGVGYVGSKLLNWNGTLQEAGGIFWKDGSAWNFGRDRDPRLPEFNYQKDTDYCSGASIATPSSVWRELGGFDETFMPAYCEDSDYAFRVRQLGLRVIYQPHSQVIHHEGRSHGRDTSSGIKAYQTRNQRKLLQRWQKVLSEQNFENGTNLPLARDRSREKQHILVVDHYVPQWDRDAGSRTMYHYIRMLVENSFQVTFWPDNLNRDREYVTALQKLGVEVIYGPQFIDRFETWLLNEAPDFNHILLSRPHIAVKYLEACRKTRALLLYYGHDLHFARLELQYKREPSEELRRLMESFKEQELRICGTVDKYLYPSQEEIDRLEHELGRIGHGLAIPMNIFGPDEIVSPEAAHFIGRSNTSVLFVGGFTHSPNVDGILWFIREVWPYLLQRKPNAQLLIVGSNAPEDLLRIQGVGVEVLGRVSDETLAELYRTCGVAIAPLRYGGGVKGKVIEALAKGVPVVTTSVGAQGIPSANNIMMVADSEKAFSDAVVDLLDSPELAMDLTKKAHEFIQDNYSRSAVFAKLHEIFPVSSVAIDDQEPLVKVVKKANRKVVSDGWKIITRGAK